MLFSVSRLLHPASGALILGLDWLLFSGTVATLGLSTVGVAVLGFGLGALGTGAVQRRYAHDSFLKSLMKGIFGSVAVGVPLPIAGTVAGGAILTMSGLDQLFSGTPDASTSKPSSPSPDGPQTDD